ncbi:hypothetical protein [Amycolatopsis alkalitolerans]|uniref:Vegetative cell wall protein gp1 n=1 Tax=Amycolatopsis alkalitolerans TaxID=2547244 RepID=A0A5C4M1C4_9PSEU|nr:hypothetical protein [Amycolatopsis alkalitolerans]TNC26419.1 hypothetical protein FG385_11725 [Amycolatopsis alkalitolerans]
MTGLLAEFGKKLAERWAAVLVLPGLVFVAVATVAFTLRQRHWADVGALTRFADRLPRQNGVFATAVLLIVLLLGSFAAGLVAHALGTPVEHVLSGRWPSGFLRRALTDRRRDAWTAADERCREAGGDLAESIARRNRIAMIEPRSPTWIGDRLAAPAIRIRDDYGLDLPFTWSRLWLLLPESSRQPLTESRRRFDDATALGGWAVLYLLLGIVWWPAAVAGVVVWLVAWRRCRAAAEVYADLVEAAVDVHVGDFLGKFTGETGVLPARPQWGEQLTERFRKGM